MEWQGGQEKGKTTQANETVTCWKQQFLRSVKKGKITGFWIFHSGSQYNCMALHLVICSGCWITLSNVARPSGAPRTWSRLTSEDSLHIQWTRTTSVHEHPRASRSIHKLWICSDRWVWMFAQPIVTIPEQKQGGPLSTSTNKGLRLMKYKIELADSWRYRILKKVVSTLNFILLSTRKAPVILTLSLCMIQPRQTALKSYFITTYYYLSAVALLRSSEKTCHGKSRRFHWKHLSPRFHVCVAAKAAVRGDVSAGIAFGIGDLQTLSVSEILISQSTAKI